MKLSVLGCGRWGTYIAYYLHKIGHEVLLWGRESSPRLSQLRKTGKNEYLSLDESIIKETSLESAIHFSDFIFISISSQHLRNFAKQISGYNLNQKTFILCMKGLENISGLRLTEVMEDVCGFDTQTAVWVGPGHVQNFVNGVPSCMVIDSKNPETTKILVHLLNSDLIRFYYGEDIIGTEVGAAAKNVVGIAAGMLDGLGYSSLKGALMARGTREMSRLVSAMGGNTETIYGLSHLGDYEATLFSEFSHNRKFGEDFVKGKNFSKLAEGVTTVKSLVYLSKKYNVELPISNVVYAVLYKNMIITEGLVELFLRPTKHEFKN